MSNAGADFEGVVIVVLQHLMAKRGVIVVQRHTIPVLAYDPSELLLDLCLGFQ
jgi:hypothetical protein